jgi:hypothetical protein
MATKTKKDKPEAAETKTSEATTPDAPKPEAKADRGSDRGTEPQPDPTTYVLVAGKELKKSRSGLVTKVFEALSTDHPLTAQQVTDKLLADGSYQEVAPKAAEKRPLKPVQTLLNQLRDAGIAKAQ